MHVILLPTVGCGMSCTNHMIAVVVGYHIRYGMLVDHVYGASGARYRKTCFCRAGCSPVADIGLAHLFLDGYVVGVFVKRGRL